jgi:hypothetical protein
MFWRAPSINQKIIQAGSITAVLHDQVKSAIKMRALDYDDAGMRRPRRRKATGSTASDAFLRRARASQAKKSSKAIANQSKSAGLSGIMTSHLMSGYRTKVPGRSALM